MQPLGQLGVVAGANDHVGAQHDLREPPSIGAFHHQPLSRVAIVLHGDARLGAEVQIPELVAGRGRGDQEVLRVPAVRIAPESWVGRAWNRRLGPRLDHMGAVIGAIAARAFAPVAGPFHVDFVSVLSVRHDRPQSPAFSSQSAERISYSREAVRSNSKAPSPAG